jgi:hypothetical protein
MSFRLTTLKGRTRPNISDFSSDSFLARPVTTPAAKVASLGGYRDPLSELFGTSDG